MRGIAVLTASIVFAGGLAAEPPVVRRGVLVEGMACRSDPSQTYTLYLPTTYTAEKRFPALVILDPRGRSALAAELFREPAETYGWVILSSDNTRSDGPMEPNIKAINALWPEVHTRYATDPKRVYAAGFSGGAHVAWILGTQTGGLAGVIATGGRFLPDLFGTKASFALYGTAGTVDFNYQGMKRVDAMLEEQGVPHRLEHFVGAHQWMPPELARLGVEWLELLAMKEGTRPRDDALVARLLAADTARANALEASGDLLDALRHFRTIVASYQGLADVAEARGKVAALAVNGAVRAQEKDERHWDDVELTTTDRMFATLARLQDVDVPLPPGRLLRELRVETWLERAKEHSYGGVTAQRILEAIFTRTAFYLTQDFFAKQNWPRAITVLTVALAVHGDSTGTWYNLACAHARAGHPQEALDALAKAVEFGFSNRTLLRTDADLDAIRGLPRFATIVGRLASEPTPGDTGPPQRR